VTAVCAGPGFCPSIRFRPITRRRASCTTGSPAGSAGRARCRAAARSARRQRLAPSGRRCARRRHSLPSIVKLVDSDHHQDLDRPLVRPGPHWRGAGAARGTLGSAFAAVAGMARRALSARGRTRPVVQQVCDCKVALSFGRRYELDGKCGSVPSIVKAVSLNERGGTTSRDI